MAESAHVNNKSESDSDSVSVNSAEPEDVDNLEQLANDIFWESEDKNYEFHGFYDDDTVRQIFGDSDDKAEPFKGFDVRFTMPDKFEDGWKMELPTAFDRYVSDDYILPNCVPTINKADDNFTYLDYFQLFVTDDIIVEICQFIASNATHNGKQDFQVPTVEELKAYFGLYTVANDFIVTLSDRRFFIQDESKWLFHTPGFSNVFTCKRYEEIKCYLHFCDPYIEIPDRSSPNYDPLYKTRPFISHLQEKFKTLWIPRPNVSIDEAMVPFKGRLGIKQFISNKPVSFGVKLWELGESATGYCYKFDVYICKSKNDTNPVLGKSATVVLNLVKGLENKNYNVYFDNYYTSVPLLLALAEKGIGACGTIRANHKYYPKDVLTADVKRKLRGTFAWRSNGLLLALMWKDRKSIVFLSSIHQPSEGQAVKRKVKCDNCYQEIEFPCLTLVNDYNKFMGESIKMIR